ncbi:MAG TPA: N-acetylmuramoyl-L-alanine amidase [Acidimicrobiia bacterium]|nr:N-acetylmuramoyl-L-alanine amidase [Acidimicrobiia bacterium]
MTTPSPTTVVGSPRVIEVIDRAGWGAAAALPGMIEHTIGRLTVHHTAVTLSDNRVAPDRLQAHQAFHQNERGWPDLAYHFAIDRAGNVYEGRDPAFRGDTATSYDPTGHFLPVLEGNFDEQTLPDAQLRSLVSLLAWAAGAYGVAPDAIGGHRDYAATSCPGSAVYARLTDGSIRAEVANLLAAGAVDLVYLRGEEAAARVAAIEAGA